ncbi:winged helix-turn-helix domain-containing protein [Thalassomonas haliotis]|uniref:Winged helix-turn-helix domain-containing protein n=1 Tax=Thalassomonas haliotis TaxID=485448 RepID=A0ABY7VL71_9GAMM|nr:winged helix-turn-helix domain-containing protein [Thalassomonas haliotis]WDE13750.1 winged helix-turn-helix domain-containing protein [Thalassomonas haliotis]
MDAALPDLFLFDDWRIDCVQNLAWRGKRRVHVEPKAMMVLQYLAARPGTVVTREELFNQFWPNQVVTQDALNRVMSTLRRAFNDNACHPKYIATVRKVGYKLVAPVITLENPRTKALLELHGGQEPVPGQVLFGRDACSPKGGEYKTVKSFPARYFYLACFFVLSLVIFLGGYTLASYSRETSVPVTAFSIEGGRSELAGYVSGGKYLRYFEKNLAPVETRQPGSRRQRGPGNIGEDETGPGYPAFLNGRKVLAISLKGRISVQLVSGLLPGKGGIYHHLFAYRSRPPGEAA